MTDQSRNSSELTETDILESDLWMSHWRIEQLSWAMGQLIHSEYNNNRDNSQLVEAVQAINEVIGEHIARAADVNDKLVARHKDTFSRFAEALGKVDKLQQELSNVTRAKEDCRSAFS